MAASDFPGREEGSGPSTVAIKFFHAFREILARHALIPSQQQSGFWVFLLQQRNTHDGLVCEHQPVLFLSDSLSWLARDWLQPMRSFDFCVVLELPEGGRVDQ
jgi:hypothetical protein